MSTKMKVAADDACLKTADTLRIVKQISPQLTPQVCRQAGMYPKSVLIVTAKM